MNANAPGIDAKNTRQAVVVLLLLMIPIAAREGAALNGDLFDQANANAANNMRVKALHSIRRHLENYGQLAARELFSSPSTFNLLPSTEGSDHNQTAGEEEEASSEQETALGEPTPSTSSQVPPAALASALRISSSNGNQTMMGIRVRVRADIKETKFENEERSHSQSAMSSKESDEEAAIRLASNRRHLRSTAQHRQRPSSSRGQQETSWNGPTAGAGSSHNSHHHRRRRKGCPPMHGKEQLLCPSRNAHRYDVCITRDALCNHVQDCPGGEDEDPKQCLFYKPLDDQLKTLSHAVLLLVDSVMSEQLKRNEL